MEFLGGVTGKYFRQDEQGREIYYFWGRFGKGRIVPTPADGAWLRRYIKVVFVVVLIGAIAAAFMIEGPRSSKLMQLLPGVLIVTLIAGIPVWLRVRNWALSDLPRFDKKTRF